MYVLAQVSSLQAQLSAAQSNGSSLSAQLQQLSSDKSALSSANATLQQALMDKTLQAAKEADALRQQQAQQLAALRAEHQQQMDALAASAAAANDAHRQVRVTLCTPCNCVSHHAEVHADKCGSESPQQSSARFAKPKLLCFHTVGCLPLRFGEERALHCTHELCRYDLCHLICARRAFAASS